MGPIWALKVPKIIKNHKNCDFHIFLGIRAISPYIESNLSLVHTWLNVTKINNIDGWTIRGIFSKSTNMFRNQIVYNKKIALYMQLSCFLFMNKQYFNWVHRRAPLRRYHYEYWMIIVNTVGNILSPYGTKGAIMPVIRFVMGAVSDSSSCDVITFVIVVWHM